MTRKILDKRSLVESWLPSRLRRVPVLALVAIAVSAFIACSDSNKGQSEGVATTQAALSGGTDPVVRYAFNETSGTLASDSSGNGHSATLVGGATFATGSRGNAARINGGTQRVELPPGVVQRCDDLTIAARVNLAANSANWTRIFDIGANPSSYMYLTPRAGAANILRFGITTSGGAGEQLISHSFTFPTNSWKHVAVVLSGNTGTMYLDGVQVAQNTNLTLNPSALGATANNWLGDSQFAADPTLNGSVDDLLVSCRPYSAAEVAWLANGTDPVAQYTFNETSGTTATDSSGAGRNATLANGASFVAGLHGNAVQVAGGTQRVNLPTSIVQSCTDLTIAAHVRLATNTANWAHIFDIGANTTSYMFLTPRAGASNILRFAITTGGTAAEQRLSSTFTFPTNTWKHVAVTLSGNTGTLYVDGVQVAQNTSMTLNPNALGATANNWLGDSQFAADPTLNGSIDNLTVSCRAFSPAEIGNLAGACSSAANCNDGNACTADACTSGFCSRSKVSDGTSCADATVCNGAESCQNGFCATGTAPVVDDGNACTTDACDPVTGVRHTPITGGACGGGGAGGRGGAGGAAGSGGGGTTGSGATSGTGGVVTCPAGTTAVEMFIELPPGVARNTIALGSYGTPLDLHDRVRVLATPTTFASVSSLTDIQANPTRLGVEAHVQDLWAEPRVELRDRAHVHGDARSPGTVTPLAGAVIDGQIVQQTLTPRRRESWLVCHPNTHQGNIDLQPGQTFPSASTRLNPGAWGTLAVKAGARLRLRGNTTYYFESMAIEPNAIIDLDTAAGGTQLYFKNGGFFRGTQARTDTRSNVLFGSENGNFTIGGSFNGTVVAPRGVVDLPTVSGGVHRGSFFGAFVIAHQAMDIFHEPVDTTGMCTPGTPNGLCPSDGGAVCGSDGHCKEGLACLTGFGPHFGLARGTNACGDPSCRIHSFELGCGYPDAKCGPSCDDGVICERDSDCPSGEICGIGKGSTYGLPFANVCLPSICVSNPIAGGCGTVGSRCGECPCTPNCTNKQCGQNPHDGCGGTCREICDNREPGCTGDSDCPAGDACFLGGGPRIALSEGANVCLPSRCLDPNPARSMCGNPTSECGRCPEQPAEDVCENLHCSTDPSVKLRCGLGDCGSGSSCVAGECVEDFSIRSLDLHTVSPATRAETVIEPLAVFSQATELVPGAVGGDFGINERGRATYTIPIIVPPGRARIAPELSLRYVGGSPNGLLGVGWTLGGLSSISRCPRIAARNQVNGVPGGWAVPVEYTNKDELCLDGQPLVLVPNSAPHFTVGAEYRTEIDSFSKIVALERNGHFYFRVMRKDGRIFTYGGALNSEMHRLRSFGLVRAWALSRIEDRVGNYIRIAYGKFVDDGRRPDEFGEDQTVEFWPREIAYGGLENSQGSAPATRSVTFGYVDDRKDYMEGYTRGRGRVARTKLLTRVDTMIGSRVVRSYELSYESAPTGAPAPELNGISRLHQIRECSRKHGSRECKRPTTFTYANQIGFSDANSDGQADVAIQPELHIGQHIVPLDWNGDGLDDIFSTAENGKLLVATGDRAQPYRPIPVDIGVCPQVFDFDHDGRDDILDGCGGNILRSTGNDNPPFEFPALHLSDGFSETRQYLADLNGDGVKDLFACSGDTVQFQLGHVGEGFDSAEFPRGQIGAWGSCTGLSNPAALDIRPAPILVVDIDGDGSDDVLMSTDTHSDRPTWARYSPKPDGTAQWLPLTLPFDLHEAAYNGAVRFVDVNGDGLKDLYTLLERPILFLNLGGEFDQGHAAYMNLPIDSGATINSINSALPVDYTGDGREDLLRVMPVSTAAVWQLDLGTQNDPTAPLRAGMPWLLPDPGIRQGRSYVAAQPGVVPIAGFTSGSARLYSLARSQTSGFGDVDGDGSPDLLMSAEGGGVAVVYSHLGREHLLASVVDGMGKQVDITYGAAQGFADGVTYRTHIPSHNCYATDAALGASLFGVCAKRVGPIVSRYTVRYDKGVGIGTAIDRTSVLRYEGGRQGLFGRGWLGFDRRVIEERAPLGDEGTRSLIKHTEIDQDNRTFDTVHKLYPFAGLESRRLTTTPFAQSVLEREPSRQETLRTNHWLFGRPEGTATVGRPFPYLESSVLQEVDVMASGARESLPAARTSYQTDNFGNVKNRTTVVTWRETKYSETMVAKTYDLRPNDWLVGLPHRIDVTDRVFTDDESSTATRSMEYGFDALGLLEHTTRQPDAPADSSQRQEVTYTRSSGKFRLVTGVTVMGAWKDDDGEHGSGRRKTTIEYDADSTFPARIHRHHGTDICAPANAHTVECQTTDLRFDTRDGTLIARVAPNGIGERFSFDAFARPTAREGAAGRLVTTYTDTGSNEEGLIDVFPCMKVTTTSQTTGESASRYLDPLGRVVQEDMVAFNGKLVRQEYEYLFGDLVSRVSRPHLPQNGTQGFDTQLYDARFRPIVEIFADNTSSRLDYATSNTRLPGVAVQPGEVRTIRHTNQRGLQSFARTSVRANLARSIDANGRAIRYRQGPFEVLEQIDEITPQQTTRRVVTIVSDDWSRMLSHRDEDTGTTRYAYTAFDDLFTQTDNAKRKTIQEYDDLGRLERSNSTVDGLAEFAYDGPGDNAIGQLVESASGDGNIEHHTFEPAPPNGASLSNRGFLARIERHLAGETFTTSFDYNEKSQLSRARYPSSAEQAFDVHYGYDGFGNLSCVSDHVISSPETCDKGRFWKLEEDFQGYRIGLESFGNDTATAYTYQALTGRIASIVTKKATSTLQNLEYTTYDPNGNLTFRRQTFKNIGSPGSTAYEQRFTYDVLDRLDFVFNRDAGGAESVALDIDYDDSGNIIRKLDVGVYDYGPRPDDSLDAPHAVRAVSRGSVEVATFSYDAAGNMKERRGEGVAGGVQTLTHTGFNLPKLVTVGERGALGTKELRYGYDALNQRVSLQVESDGDPAPEDQRLYIGDGYERQVTEDDGGPVIRHIYKVFAAGRQVAQTEREVRGPAVVETRRYLHGDHQGSSQIITDETGDLVRVQRFDAFGKSIDPVGPSSDSATRIRTGYTGHETDIETGLINMRGRIYDARLGRFLQADPVLYLGSFQGLNRYSYVFNNPLNLTDPSGFEVGDPSTYKETRKGEGAEGGDQVVFNDDTLTAQNQASGATNMTAAPQAASQDNKTSDQPATQSPTQKDASPNEGSASGAPKDSPANPGGSGGAGGSDKGGHEGGDQRGDTDRGAGGGGPPASDTSSKTDGTGGMGESKGELRARIDDLNNMDPFQRLDETGGESLNGFDVYIEVPPSEVAKAHGGEEGNGPTAEADQVFEYVGSVEPSLSQATVKPPGEAAVEAAAKQTVKEAAAKVAAKAGKHRVEGVTAGGKKVSVDLKGKEHFDKATQTYMKTPHVHEATLHKGPGGSSWGDKTVRPATMQDIRMADKILKSER